MAKKLIEKTRIATYIENDILKWVKSESLRLRTNESAFIRQVLAERMESSK